LILNILSEWPLFSIVIVAVNILDTYSLRACLLVEHVHARSDIPNRHGSNQQIVKALKDSQRLMQA
jgi:hypothetical protein